MQKIKLPAAVRSASRRFSSNRIDYYGWMSNMISASKGSTKILTLFERDVIRFKGKPRGTLAAYWAIQYANNGGRLALAWQGTLPADEVAIIAVAEDAGANALPAALADTARIAGISDSIKWASISTMAVAIFGALLAGAMWTFYPIFASGILVENYSFLPTSEWGPKGRAALTYVENVRAYGVFVVAGIALLIFWLVWSINNLTGDVRDWLDQHNIIFRTVRDIKGAMFLATMSTLTRRRGNVQLTLSTSLRAVMNRSSSTWTRWRISQIIEGIDRSGGLNSEAFNTRLLSPEMYFHLRDLQEATSFAEGFEATGAYVESKILARIIQRLKLYRGFLLLLAVGSVAFIVLYQGQVIYEMKSAITSYFGR